MAVEKTCEAEIKHTLHGTTKSAGIEGLCDYTIAIIVVKKKKLRLQL